MWGDFTAGAEFENKKAAREFFTARNFDVTGMGCSM
jgi:hypothetical protein